MPFAAPDLRDLTDALRLHPEWREEVRRLVLTEEVLRLPALVAELAAAQRRTEQRLEELAAAQERTEARLEQLSERMEELAAAQRRTEQRLEELVAAQERTEARLEQLSERMEELAAAQRRTEQRLEELVAAQVRTENKVAELADGQKRLVDRSAHFEGELLELHYARKAGSYFGRLIRRARVVTFQDLEDQLRSSLGDSEVEEVLNLDLMVGGRLLSFDPPREVLLAVEVSVAISHDDVERASRRAEVLRRATGVVIPVVAGRGGTLEVEDHARDLGVTILYDGKARLWPESVDRWTTAPA